MTSSKKRQKKEKPDPDRAERDRVALDKHSERRKHRLSARVKITNGGGASRLSLDHPDQFIGMVHLMQALATAYPDFADGILMQLADATFQGKDANESRINFVLSVIKGIEPKDQLETMLATQMAAVHMATMTFAHRLGHGKTLEEQDSADRAFNRLARTFATQMEALKRYRTGGEQKMTVQHVTVGEGGQAIVGNVTQAARDHAPSKSPTSPLAITDTKTIPMPVIGENENKVATPAPARRRRNK